MKNESGEKPTKLTELKSLDGYVQAEIFPMYANLIVDGATDEEIIRINQMIIAKWSNAALILIKDKAWRIVNQTKKYHRLTV
jgi:hypothetical protein